MMISSMKALERVSLEMRLFFLRGVPSGDCSGDCGGNRCGSDGHSENDDLDEYFEGDDEEDGADEDDGAGESIARSCVASFRLLLWKRIVAAASSLALVTGWVMAPGSTEQLMTTRGALLSRNLE
jgi:hypothetical protein